MYAYQIIVVAHLGVIFTSEFSRKMLFCPEKFLVAETSLHRLVKIISWLKIKFAIFNRLHV
jgi:hypothetical protein